MMTHFLTRSFLPIALLCTATLSGVSASEVGTDPRPALGIQQKQGIKVVFQITSAATEAGVSKDLAALKGTYHQYLKEGVRPAEIHLHAVIHGNAADHLLTNEAWKRLGKGTGDNPSTTLINELLDQGVHLELCDSRRKKNGWEKSDIHPGITLVGNAYHRLADLQLQGHAYIRL